VNFPLLKTGLIVDFDNLYVALQSKYEKLLLVEKYVKYLEDTGHTLIYKIGYSPQKPDLAMGFIQLLRAIGFDIYFGKELFGVDMALKAADIVPNIDCLILGSNAAGAATILSWAKNKGKITKCFASLIPSNFKEVGTCIEIPESMVQCNFKKAQIGGVVSQQPQQ
jgi:hypothetical protein